MSKLIEIHVPDIGDFTDIPVIEVLVSAGQHVDAEQSLVTLESDKATMEVPSPVAGVVNSVDVKLGDAVSAGTLVATLNAENIAVAVDGDNSDAQTQYDFEVLVLGAGPGGYTAAFRAADLGLKVVLVERYPTLGGVCLNVGCIPSKALLHATAVIDEATALAERGVVFGKPVINTAQLRAWKDTVVGQLTGGLTTLSKQRGVTVIQGVGKFSEPHAMSIVSDRGNRSVSFARAIIAAGSHAFKLPGLPWDDPRLMDSTDALELDGVPKRLLVIGGGVIGLEMASVYRGLGSEVTVVELTDQLMPGTDKDLVRPLQKRISKRYNGIHVNTKVTSVEPMDNGLQVTFEGGKTPANTLFDGVLAATGRIPNGAMIDASAAGVEITGQGFIPVDRQMRTNVEHIFAIGDIVGQPMLAHKATHEARVAAEVCAGMKSTFEARVIPSVAYTDPEIAWAGLTETRAKEQGIEYTLGKFPWAASGRAMGLGRTEGFTKLLFEPATRRVIGAGIVGLHAGDLIAECVLAIEMGCEAEDIGLSIHPHPTLSETIAMSSEVFAGTITDLYIP